MVRLIFLCIFAVLTLFTQEVRGDWINLSGAENSQNVAEFYVLGDRVRVVLEIFPNDFPKFLPIIPDEFFGEHAGRRPGEQERLKDFAENYLRIAVPTGTLPAELALVERRLRKIGFLHLPEWRNPYTGGVVPGPPDDKRVLYVELEYPFSGQPEWIKILPPHDEEGGVSASIGFITYHRSVPVIDFRYLSSEATLHLNWEDPWYSKFENQNLVRHHRNPLMPFIYVEPFEVRFEVLSRIKDLKEWIDLDLGDDKVLSIEKAQAVRKAIGDYFLTQTDLYLDGVKAENGELDRVNFVSVSLAGIQILEEAVPLELSTAMVGVILAYQTDGMPKEVRAPWRWFPEKVDQVPALSVDPAGPFQTTVTREDNEIIWTNHLKNFKLPTVAAVSLDERYTRKPLPIISALCFTFVLFALPVGVANMVRGQAALKVLVPALALALFAAVLPASLQPAIARPPVFTSALPDRAAVGVLEALLKNVYRSFDFKKESAVYDKLATSVEGDLLTDIYLQSRKSLRVKKAGGAQAKVKEVEILETAVTPVAEQSLAFSVDAKWTAEGTVGHWGHTHMRKNRYHADIEVAPVDGRWKITKLAMKEEQRIDPFGEEQPQS